MRLFSGHISIISILRYIKKIYQFIRFSAIGFTVFMTVLGLASVGHDFPGYTIAGIIVISIAFHIHVYLLNDLIDLEIDKTEPFRAEDPLVRGDISKSSTFLIALGVIPFAFLITRMLSSSADSILYLSLAFCFLTLYNLFGKRINLPMIMDAVQGLGWASLVFFGASIVQVPPSKLTFLVAGLAFVYTMMINGLHGALRDLENDIVCGAKTTAILMGAKIYRSSEIYLPKSFTRYAISLQIVFIILSFTPLVFNWFAHTPLQWWTSSGLILGAHLLSIYLFYRILQSIKKKWDLFYYGMLHLVLTLGIFLLLFIFSLEWSLLIILLLFYIIPIALMWIFGGIRWDDWKPEMDGSQSAALESTLKLFELLELIRPQNIALVFAYTILGAYLSQGITIFMMPHVMLAGVVVSLITAFGNVFNDYMDRDVDKLEYPNRPIPSGRISSLATFVFAIFLAIVAVIVASKLSIELFIMAIISLLLSCVYSIYFKRTVLLGNLLVALLVAMVLIFGGVVSGGLTPSIWVASALTFFYSLTQEILFDIEDIEGDRKAGIQTIATYFGTRKALIFYRVLACFFIGAAFWPWFAGWVSDWYFYTVIPCTILPTIGIVMMLGGEVATKTFQQAVNYSWYVGFTSIVPVLLMKA